MKRIGRRIRGTVFGVAVAAGLGFGAAQALAAPGPDLRDARSCQEDRICTFQCGAAGGYNVYRGICICCLPSG